MPAVRLRSEEEFLNKLLEHCLADSPFLFGSDSCNVATAFYHHCLEHVADEALRAKFLLITAETGTRIKNASEDFKDKFVFYSPKITFGVDFSSLTSQDVFIHITGNSIQPSGSYQQTTRCRNIRTLYYFGECSSDLSFYNSLAEVRADVEQAIATSKTFNSTCTYLDEFDQIQVVKNTFFNLYCLNEFTRDTYSSNMIKHFELLLKANGFRLSAQGEKQLISITGMIDEINEKTFEDWLEKPECNNPRFNQLLKNINYLLLNPFDRETLTKFKDIVMNRRRVEEHDAAVRFLKSDEHLEAKIADLSFNCLEAKAVTSTYQKIKLLRAAEAKWGFTSLENEMKDFSKLDEPLFKLLSHTFRLRRANPNTQEEAAKLYKTLVNKLAFNNLLHYTKKGGFAWNTAALKKHLDLNKFKNTQVKGFAPAVVEKFGLVPELVPQGLFTDMLDA